jgi:hypothetical protein
MMPFSEVLKASGGRKILYLQKIKGNPNEEKKEKKSGKSRIE